MRQHTFWTEKENAMMRPLNKPQKKLSMKSGGNGKKKSAGLQPAGGRKFGDISNRMGQTVDQRQSNKQAAKPKVRVTNKVKMTEDERDFFPDIVETEDYSDILPPSLELTPADLQSLCQPWLCLQRPSLPLSPPSSPSLDGWELDTPCRSYDGCREEEYTPLQAFEFEEFVPENSPFDDLSLVMEGRLSLVW